MNGRTHLIYGFGFVMLICAFLLWLAHRDIAYDYPSLLACGVGGAFGALFPDFDVYLGMGFHRNTLTHSSILPVLTTIAYAFTPDIFARTLLMFICIGMITHFWLDLFINDVPKEHAGNIVSRWVYRIGAFIKGNVGGSFKGFGSKWANDHERTYLLTHIFICLVCVGLLFWGIYNSIDIVGWWPW